ncbi:MAG: PQQ-binding-like beta-propeller repeat protein [Planctomycetaceae bacterium]
MSLVPLRSRRLVSSSLILAWMCVAGPRASAEENWPRFRGPHQDGQSLEEILPVHWSADDVAWRVPLKGEGHSSPVLWGDRIFLTTALERGKQRVVQCFHRGDGKLLWEHVAWTGTPEESHKMNGWASATCATDGEHVYAFFGRGGGLFCYTLDGKLVWNKGNDELGDFPGPWGTAACPVIVGDLVIQNCDADDGSYLLAVDKRTGETAWKTVRPPLRGWSTPILFEAAGRQELVVNGDKGVQAYDPETGKELWFCKSFDGRGDPSLILADGLVIALNGKPAPLYAVKPGGDGDVSESRRAWVTPRSAGRDLPSPVLVGGEVLIVNMQGGILTSYDLATGKELWKERVGGNYAASPVAYSGHALFVGESGETVVVKPDASPRVVARNKVNATDEEIFRASPALSEGQVFLRSDGALYCIGKRRTAAE